MTRSLLVLFAGLALAACGNNSGGGSKSPDGGGAVDSGGTTTPGGPEFLSFGTNITTMTESDTVTFVAVLTSPEGLSNLVGGHLTDPTGQIQFGAFTATNQGSYSLSLTWTQIYQATSCQFVGQSSVHFVAEFFDVQGRNTTKDVTLTLACQGATWGTCSGPCYDFANDFEHCGGCGTCDGIGTTEVSCSQGSCVAEFGDDSHTMSCMAICAAASGTCSTACGNFPGNVSSHGDYECTDAQSTQDDFACGDVPPATEDSCPIIGHVCCCGIVPAG